MWKIPPSEAKSKDTSVSMTRSAATMEPGDVSKQHLRALSDAARRAEASQDNMILRQHVKECAEKLIFALPLEFGTQGEDHLWKKAFYEPFARFKAKRDQMTLAQQLSIEQLLLSGLGTYQQVLSRLELDFGAPLVGIVDVSLSRSNAEKTIGRRVEEFPPERRAELQEWALKCAYRCLLALGDLSRYLHDLDCQRKNGVSPHRSAAFRYYHQATLTRSSQGQPYNQLGTLTTGELAGLKEVYFYLRCLLCSEPFMGARNNLNMSFDKNRAALAMAGNMSSGGWESGVRTLLSLTELLWQGDVPKANMVNFVLRVFHYDQPLRRDVQFYALLVLLALDQKLTRNTTKKGENEQSAAWVVARDLLFALGGRICRELHHRLCLRICSKHPFNEKTDNSHSHETTDGQQENNNCIIPTSQTNGSSGDSGSGSVRRHSAKPKIVRRRRAFGDGDSDEEDDNGGRGAGDGGQYGNGAIEIDSNDETQKGPEETEQPKMNGGTTKNMNGQIKKAVQQSRRHTNSSGESSEDSMSSSAGWSSSSDDDSESEDEASDDAFDSDADQKPQKGASEKENPGNREKGGGGKMPPARLSPSYTLDKALSCKQLVKQVASEELLPAAKLFLDWLMLLSSNTCKSQTIEDDMNNKKTQVDSALPLRIVKYVADLANLLCVVKYRVMFGSDSTIEHVRSRLNDLSVQRNSAMKKREDSDEAEPTANAKPSEDFVKKELILPEDVHFPLEAAPALRTLTIYKKADENATAVHHKYDWILSWGERSSLATEGQRAVYRMHLIADRAADICGRLEGATVLREERITFEQKLQEKITESISREATPPVETSPGTSGNGRQNTRGRNGRGNSIRGTRGERGAGDTEKQQVMMKSMAHAWLRHEVEGLEERLEGSAARNGTSPLGDMNGICANSEGNISQYGRGGGGNFNGGIGGTVVGCNGSMFPMISLSPFVVVDSSALSTRLAAVRAIASQKRSILAVPTCVLSHLDEMKKDVAQARDATRWLETEMRKGSRFVQVLGPGEASKISLLKYPKRKDREAWHLFQLLECCHHLGNGGAINHGIAGKHGKQDGSHRNFRARGGIAAIQSGAVLVSLLIARAESDLPSNAATLADAIGVKLVDVDDIFGKAPSARQMSIASKGADAGTANGVKSAAASSVATAVASLENGKHNVSNSSSNNSSTSNETDRIKHAGG